MIFRIDSLQWKPATVSWVSFLIIAIVVAGIGLVGNRRVIQLMEDEFILLGVDHDRAIADRMLPLLREPLKAGMASQDVVSQFQEAIAHAETFGTSVFLIDTETDTVIAHSDRNVVTDHPRSSELMRAPARLAHTASMDTTEGRGVIRATSYQGRPVLIYLTHIRIGTANSAGHWMLAVERDVTDLIEAVDRLRGPIDVILLGTDALIAFLGFVILRRVGRFYEQSLEKKVRERTEELQVTHAKMLRKACLATIGQTASMLTHELRNPLAAIKLGLSGLQGADYLRERERRRVNIAIREVDRLDELLAQTLDYVRPIKRSGEPVMLDRQVDTVLDLVAPLLTENNLQVQRTACEACPGTRIDTHQMQQALLNLLKNAIEASPRGGTIRIATRAQTDRLILDICNDGPPITPADIERVLEPFYSTKPKGTGLGLTLVKRVIDEHGGELSIESSAETGTCVTVSLPILNVG